MSEWLQTLRALKRNALANKGMLPEQQERVDLSQKPEDPFSAPIPEGVRLKGKVDDWLAENVVEPAARAGYPNAGAAVATVPSVIADLAIPQAAGDIAAMPFGRITKALKKTGAAEAAEKAAVKSHGLMAPAEREIQLKRINAVEAARQVVKGDGQKLGQGVDLGAHEALNEVVKDGVKTKVPSGVVVKSGAQPLWNPKESGDNATPPMDRKFQAEDTARRFSQEEALFKGDKDELDPFKRELGPETFLVETPRGNSYHVQDKADATIGKDFGRKEVFDGTPLTNRIGTNLDTRAEQIELTPFDTLRHPDNLGRYGTVQPPEGMEKHSGPWPLTMEAVDQRRHPYKIIDPGNYRGIAPSAADSPRRIKPPKKK